MEVGCQTWAIVLIHCLMLTLLRPLFQSAKASDAHILTQIQTLFPEIFQRFHRPPEKLCTEYTGSLRTPMFTRLKSQMKASSLYYLPCSSNTLCRGLFIVVDTKWKICKLPVARAALRIPNLAGGSSVVTICSAVTPRATRGLQGFLFSHQLCPHSHVTPAVF